jgi:CHASE2 domain-containing sensor protein
MSKLRWFVVFAMGLAAVSAVAAVVGQWLPAIYVLILAGFMLALDRLDEK